MPDRETHSHGLEPTRRRDALRKTLRQPGTPKRRVAGLPQAIDAVAREIGVAAGVIALAWLLKHPANIMPIVGSMDSDRIVN